MKKKFKCPSCKKVVIEAPALSRIDNKTEICSKCGMMEAIKAYKEHESKKISPKRASCSQS